MNHSIACISLVVRDYDEAIAFYTGVLPFSLLEDTVLSASKRWVVVGPRGGNGARLLLAKAATPEQQTRVGNQTGGRVAFFLHTDDFASDHRALQTKGVRFLGEPRQEPYSTVAVFEDLYGNRWDLVQPTISGTAPLR